MYTELYVLMQYIQWQDCLLTEELQSLAQGSQQTPVEQVEDSRAVGSKRARSMTVSYSSLQFRIIVSTYIYSISLRTPPSVRSRPNSSLRREIK